ncbi:MAG TPA: hypothetical protein VLV15_07510 [Dongiaceae bacterium]|nr:hypothetical protein [Dongiaceae bacterium]
MANPVDPNEVLMTGENSFVRLSHDGGKTLADRASHWRVLWCPAGSGTTLFLQSELTDNKVRVYSDNAAVARWLQKTIESLLFPAFADTNLPVITAAFARAGDARSTAVETATSATDRVTLTWWDTLEPFVLTMPPGMNGRPIGVFSTFFPARSAQIELNGRVASGKIWPEQRGDRQSSSACLAWSESWVKPRG